MIEDLEKYRTDIDYCKECLGMQGARNQKVYRFPNGYGAFLISAPRLGGPPRWTINTLRFKGDEYVTVNIEGVVNGSTSDWEGSLKALEIIMSKPHF
jgi:hypothetical protein